MNEEKLTPEQSLQILDTIAAKTPLSRSEHITTQQAVQVLAELVTKEVEEKNKEEKTD